MTNDKVMENPENSFIGQVASLNPVSDPENIYRFLSAGTDGSNAPTDAAGAFVAPELMEKMVIWGGFYV